MTTAPHQDGHSASSSASLSSRVSGLSLNISKLEGSEDNPSSDVSCEAHAVADSVDTVLMAREEEKSLLLNNDANDITKCIIQYPDQVVNTETVYEKMDSNDVMFGEVEFLNCKKSLSCDDSEDSSSYIKILEDFYHSVDDGYADCMEKIVSLYNIDVNLIFNGNFDFVKRKHRGWCAIHIAASNRDLKLIRYLLSEGSNVEATTLEGETALHIAAKHGAAKVVNVLLECNVFLRDRQNNQGVTALMKAIFNSQHVFKGNYRRCTELLIASGCNPNISSSSRVTALHVAVDKCSTVYVSQLLEAGAQVNALDTHNTSSLCHALISKHVNSDVVRLLLEAGADISLQINGRSMLHIAVARCDDRIIKSFIQRGADPNCRDQSCKTPLWVAVEENNVTVVPILLQGGGDMNFIRQPQCVSLLSQAVMLNSLSMVKVLLRHGATTHTETLMWSTPLHMAVDVQNISIIRELLRHNCLLNTTSNAKFALRPMTPVQLALELGNLEITCLLMQAGCRVSWAWLREDRMSLALATKPEAVHHIQTLLSGVQPLVHLSRLALRECTGPRFSVVMTELRRTSVLPKKMLDYLYLTDVLDSI